MAVTMTGDQLGRLIDGRGWSNKDVAELLNQSLGRRYKAERVGQWRSGGRPVPADVSALLERVAIDTALPSEPGPEQPQEPLQESVTVTDDPPARGPGDPVQPSAAVLPMGGGYERLCTELVEIIATGVGMVGAVLGSEKLVNDGAIIDQDKQKLGHAYAKLAQTNETFRRILTGMTTSGAWLEVAVVTGSTVGKIWRNHATPTKTAEPDERLRVVHAPEQGAAG